MQAGLCLDQRVHTSTAQVLNTADYSKHMHRVRIHKKRSQHLLLAATLCANEDRKLWYHIVGALRKSWRERVGDMWCATDQAVSL